MFFENLFRVMVGQPKWRVEFEEKIHEIQKKSGVSREELIRVANVLEEMRIIRTENL